MTPVKPTLPTPASPLITPQPLPPIPDPSSSAAPALSAASDHNFVTHSDFSAGIGELHQFLQDKIIAAIHLIASPLPLSPPVTTPRPSNPTYTASAQFTAPLAPPPATPHPALPAFISEYQPAIAYPWLPANLVDKVLQDSISIYELPKLANPSWPSSTALEDPTPVLIEGFSIVKAPTTSTSNRQFVKAVPNFLTFSRLWVVFVMGLDAQEAGGSLVHMEGAQVSEI
ncbi:hypothetical protein NDA14_001013 [Ustilago hordei]|nr:hypothetical protein NDA14_001013 [Ustilago hordei]UTT91515.1 hypothetical protein NDA17_003561 [Ustilago hordei]